MYSIKRIKYYDYEDGVICTKIATEAEDLQDWKDGFRARQHKRGHRIGYIDVLAKRRESFVGGLNLTPDVQHIRDYKMQHPELELDEIAVRLGVERYKVLISLN